MSKKEKTLTVDKEANTKTISVTDRQRQVITGIANDKAALEAEYKKVLVRGQEVMVTLLESASVDPATVADIKLEEAGVVVTMKE